MTEQPLAGRTVVDLTTALAGPYATLLLGGLGARVIKVENPRTGGDSSRGNAPYLGRDGLGLGRVHDDDMSVSMLLRGRNKESVTLDLKHPRGREVLAGLVGHADVLVENYSAGVTTRLGIDPAAMLAVNPKLVYTSISGFGAQGGPAKAMDTIVQALSGIMGTAGQEGDDPVRNGLPVGDLVAPLFAVIGTLAALVQADRTGVGQHVDVSMLGALTSLVACEPFDAYAAVGLAQRTGSLVPRLAPFGLFEAKDGWLALCGPTDRFAAGVFQAMGEPGLAADPRFATRDARVANATALHELIGTWAAGQDRVAAVASLVENGVPAAEVREPAEAVRDPLVRARDEVVALTHPSHGATADISATGVPIVFSGSAVGFDRPAPALGEHNDLVYGDLLGYDGDRLAALRADRVI
ncbi:CaiB/BaiF CoA transferase family protein [Lentzea albida]|uniref:CoA-transferase family III n=1 Tax=Lentzea albida TaxID=65499 RepID=A0A1H9MKU7_9PSEU|nr:CoA transferase [Lentzea albida]SER24238.1 CoA-transferase family III [Lentzea albida]